MRELNGIPYHREAERELVCSLIAGPDYIFRIASEVDPSYFFNTDYRAIYSKLLAKAQAGEPISEITFIDGENDDKAILIMRLFDNAITGTTAPHWAKKVREHAYARAIYTLGTTFTEHASQLESFEEADVFLREKYDAILAQFNVSSDDTFDPEGIDSICESIQAKRSNPGIHGIRTLWPIFDNVVKGLKIVTLITAASGFGKTAMGLQWAWNIGVKQRIPCLYINYEMGEDELLERLLASGSQTPLGKIQLGETDNAENARVTTARIALADGQLYITGCEEKTIDNTINLIHQYKSKHNIACVFIDYIGEIGKKDAEYSLNTYALYGDWVQRIKTTCARLNIKSIILAQLNRDGYSGPPSMQTVADSMQLVHKSHVACGLYEGQGGCTLLKIFKNRGGPIIQPIPINFDRKTQRMNEL